MAASVMVEPYHSATNEGSAVASLHSVTKKFGRQTALDRFSLQLRAGEVVALLGPAPFSSAPVRVNVYVFFGVVAPVGEFVGVELPHAGISSKRLASTASERNPISRLPLPLALRAPANTKAGASSQNA